jgi:catechol 2,3-dioxygenase-like lactoylglutathione lyase family enzyme
VTQSRLVHVGVRATDLEATIRFWRDALGLRVASTMPGCYDLTDGYHNFRVFQHVGPARPPHVSGALDYLHVGIVVDDLPATARRCLALGFQIIADGIDANGVDTESYDPDDPKYDSFKVEDPDGIVVDVAARSSQWPGIAESLTSGGSSVGGRR